MEKSTVTISKLVRQEKATNPAFRRGYNLSLGLMLTYGLVRLGEWLIFPLLMGMSLVDAMTTDMLWPLLFTAVVISCGFMGNHKWAGWLSVTTAVGLAGVILTGSRDSGVSLVDLFTYMPQVWYVAVSAVVVLVIGLVMLTSKSVRCYSIRRKELEKGLPLSLMDLAAQNAAVPSAAAATVKPQHHLRRLAIGLVCSTLLAAVGVWAMGLLVPPTPESELLHMEGTYASLEDGGVEGAYRLRLEGSDLTYTISSILADFPVAEFRAQLRPGDNLTLAYEDDDWRNIFALSSDNTTYTTYEQAIAHYKENTNWGWGMVLVVYAILVVACVTMYFRRRKKGAQQMKAPAVSESATIDWDSGAGLIRAAEKYAIEFKRAEADKTLVIGTSKIGGKPHLPEGFRWPYFEGTNYDNVRARRPLSFMAQINLADVADLDADSELPHSGFLYFFYELNTMRWGFDPEDEGCARVFYYDVTADALSATDYPDDFNPGYYLPESAIAFNRARSIPSFEEFGNSVSVDCDDYMQAAEENGIDTERSPESIFKLLGYADLIQGSILWECAMSESSLSSDAWKTLSENKKSEVYAKESKWTLLSQFGTISDSIMFGDCGCIYYYIRKEDLEKRCFDNIHLSLQCY